MVIGKVSTHQDYYFRNMTKAIIRIQFPATAFRYMTEVKTLLMMNKGESNIVEI